MKVRFELEQVVKKTLTLNVQDEFVDQMIKDFEKQGWKVKHKILKTRSKQQ